MAKNHPKIIPPTMYVSMFDPEDIKNKQNGIKEGIENNSDSQIFL